MLTGKLFDEIHTFFKSLCTRGCGLPVIPRLVNLSVIWGKFHPTIYHVIIDTEFTINLVAILLIGTHHLIIGLVLVFFLHKVIVRCSWNLLNVFEFIKENDTCIVFTDGFGFNRFEGILKFIDTCTFP